MALAFSGLTTARSGGTVIRWRHSPAKWEHRFNVIQHIDIGGIRTRYREAGDGPPLVLVHGGAIGTGSSSDVFSRNLAALAQRFHVYAVDKIGQGRTDNPRSDADYTVDCMTAHVHGFVRALKLESVFLIGQSRGAFNCASICVDDPGLVRALVICNSASMVPGVPAIPAYSKKVRANRSFAAGTEEWIRYRTARMAFSEDAFDDSYFAEWLAVYHLDKSAQARERLEALQTAQFEPSVDAAKEALFARIRDGGLKAPVLIHWGSDDRSAPLDPDGLAVFNLLKDGGADVTLHAVNGAGHFAFREKAAAFNSLVTAFFLGCSDRGSA